MCRTHLQNCRACRKGTNLQKADSVPGCISQRRHCTTDKLGKLVFANQTSVQFAANLVISASNACPSIPGDIWGHSHHIYAKLWRNNHLVDGLLQQGHKLPAQVARMLILSSNDGASTCHAVQMLDLFRTPLAEEQIQGRAAISLPGTIRMSQRLMHKKCA